MGLFSKKEKVPEIPLAQGLPDLPPQPNLDIPESRNLPELPSFPANPKNENINQEMVKHAVSDTPQEYSTPEDNEVVVDMPSQDGSHNNVHNSIIPSLPKLTPSMPSIPSIKNTPNLEQKTSLEPSIASSKKSTDSTEPIFVRIDKFQDAQRDFKQIKSKIKEIEAILRKVKETKSKEQEEIHAWSVDLEKIKARLAEIDANIFNKI